MCLTTGDWTSRTRTITIKVAKVLKRPFSSVQHIWADYRVGRAVRKLKEMSEEPDLQGSKDCKENVVEDCEEKLEIPENLAKDCKETLVEEHPVCFPSCDRHV